MNEKEIVKKLQKGNLDALKELWENYSSHVLNLSFRMLLDRDLAEDLLMDIFVQIPDAIQNFRGESSLSTWIYALTKNACLMKIRKEKVHLRIEKTQRNEIHESSFGESASESSRLAKDSLFYGLSVLTQEQRSLLWLKDAEGFDLKTLSQIFQAPEGTLKARLSRSRTQVRDFLKQEKSYA